jgi:hypothetical protein
MNRERGNRFSEKVMLKQIDGIMIQLDHDPADDRTYAAKVRFSNPCRGMVREPATGVRAASAIIILSFCLTIHRQYDAIHAPCRSEGDVLADFGRSREEI